MGLFGFFGKREQHPVERKTVSREEELLGLLDAIPVTTSIEVCGQSQDLQKLLGAIALHAAADAVAQETYIRRALEMARCNRVESRRKAFLLLSRWMGDDPRVEAAIDEGLFSGI
jgi:hypothetical protein